MVGKSMVMHRGVPSAPEAYSVPKGRSLAARDRKTERAYQQEVARTAPSYHGAEEPEEVHSVVAFLADAGLLQYAEAIVGNGFDDMETLMDIEDADMQNLGLPRGHVIKLRRHLREFTGELVRHPAPPALASDIAGQAVHVPSLVLQPIPHVKVFEAPQPPLKPQPFSHDRDWAPVALGHHASDVQMSWERLKALGDDHVGTVLFKHFSKLVPKAVTFKIFPFSKAVSAVGLCVSGLLDRQALMPKLRASGLRHVAYAGVVEEHFPILQAALMRTLQETLGGEFTREVESAWSVACSWISNIMIEAFREAQEVQVKAQQSLANARKVCDPSPRLLENGIPMKEVEKHNHAGSAWIVVKDRVYDCTAFLSDHPGGLAMILSMAGRNATDEFKAAHSQAAWDMLEEFYLGPLRKGSAAKAPSAVTASNSRDVFLMPRKVQKLPLVEKIIVNHDTRIFRFGLPDANMKLGLPTGQHVLLKAQCEGRTIVRPYTPIHDDHTPGRMDLMVKVYLRNASPDYPEGGQMSQHLESMLIGDSIEVQGPLGDFVYMGKGEFTWKGKPRKCTHMSLIAGGTGITLPYQVASTILLDAEDKTKLKLLFANQTPDDILGKWMLDDLVAKHPDRFEVWYTVDRVPEGKVWEYDVGYINDVMIQEHLFGPGEETVCLMCGPPAMYSKACVPNLLKVGYLEENIFAS